MLTATCSGFQENYQHAVLPVSAYTIHLKTSECDFIAVGMYPKNLLLAIAPSVRAVIACDAISVLFRCRFWG